MTKFSFKSAYQKAEKDYGLGKGEYFKAAEGDNPIRLMSEAVGYESEYQGKKNFKFVCWIIDRKDGKVKLYFMPVTVFKGIESLQENPEYHFSEVPMEYDIIINAKNAGTIDVAYTVFGARTNTPLTADELKAFKEKPTVGEVIEKLNNPQGQPSNDPVSQLQNEALDSLAQTADQVAERPDFLK